MPSASSASHGVGDDSRPPAARAALITGSTGELGGAIARALAVAGLQVWLGYQSHESVARDLADELTAEHGVQATPTRLDVRDRASVETAVKAVEEACGSLDVLVNAAGRNLRQSVLTVSEEALREIFEVNVIGLYLACQAAARGMVTRRSGRIVNISSIASGYALGDRSVYEASKAAVDRITQSLARELAPHGVVVNAVAPGLIESPMTLQAGRRDLEVRRRAIPVGRLGEPKEVAALVAYLATTAPAYLTGAVLKIDGGRST